jgi:hypothetical protein
MAVRLTEKIHRGFVAAVGAGAFALYAWMFYAIGVSGATHHEQAKRYAKQEAAAAGNSVERECAGLVGGALRKCETEIIAASRESQRDESALQAQRDMSEWAFWLLIIGAGQLVATIIGLAFIKGTLDATRDAVREAADGTQAALIAAEAGRSANQIARDAATDSAAFARENLRIARATARDSKKTAEIRKQIERAYMGIKVGREEVKVEPLFATIRPVIVNTGKTVGFITGYCDCFTLELPETVSYEGSGLVEYPLLMVSADGGETELPETHSPEGINKFFFFGYITYDDMFGDSHINRFCYWFNLSTGLSQPAGGKEWHAWD